MTEIREIITRAKFVEEKEKTLVGVGFSEEEARKMAWEMALVSASFLKALV